MTEAYLRGAAGNERLVHVPSLGGRLGAAVTSSLSRTGPLGRGDRGGGRPRRVHEGGWS